MTNNGTNENMQHLIQHKCFYYRDDSEVLPRYSSSKYKLVYCVVTVLRTA